MVSPTPKKSVPQDDLTNYSESGISFSYPFGYKIQGSIKDGYLSLMSPSDPDKPAKETTVGEKELKIEIVTESSKDNDDSEKCFMDHAENPNILAKEEVVVAGIPATKIQWEGLGTGEFICLIRGGTRYLINKYPIETSRNKSYLDFLASFKFE